MHAAKSSFIDRTTEQSCSGIIRDPISYNLLNAEPIEICGNIWTPAIINYQRYEREGYVLARSCDSELGKELRSLDAFGVRVAIGDQICDIAGAEGGFCQWSRLICLRREHVESDFLNDTLVHEGEHARTFMAADRGSLKALTEFSYIKRPGSVYGEFVINEIQAALDGHALNYFRGDSPISLMDELAYFFSSERERFDLIKSLSRSASLVAEYLEELSRNKALACSYARHIRIGQMYFPEIEIPIPGSKGYACVLALPKRAEQLEPDSAELAEIIEERIDALCKRIKAQSAMLAEQFSIFWGLPLS